MSRVELLRPGHHPGAAGVRDDGQVSGGGGEVRQGVRQSRGGGRGGVSVRVRQAPGGGVRGQEGEPRVEQGELSVRVCGPGGQEALSGQPGQTLVQLLLLLSVQHSHLLPHGSLPRPGHLHLPARHGQPPGTSWAGGRSGGQRHRLPPPSLDGDHRHISAGQSGRRPGNTLWSSPQEDPQPQDKALAGLHEGGQ